jgi:hypothetical protein
MFKGRVDRVGPVLGDQQLQILAELFPQLRVAKLAALTGCRIEAQESFEARGEVAHWVDVRRGKRYLGFGPFVALMAVRR